MRKLAFLLVLSSCGIDRTISEITSQDAIIHTEFRNLSPANRVRVADRAEPGEPLMLCLTFVEKSGGKAVQNQEVLFYHTSTDGEYRPANPADESTARLNGRAITDSEGRIYVETILPGDYGSSADNRHIHTTVFGARPEAYDIHFKQYTGFMGKNFIDGSDQHFLADLKKSGDELVTFLTIEIKK